MNEKIRKLLAKLAEAKPEQLQDIEEQLRAELARLAEVDATDEVLADMGALADGITQITETRTALETAEAERQTKREEILARVAPVAETPEEPPVEPATGEEPDPEAEPEPATVVEPVAEVEPVVEPIAAAAPARTVRRPSIAEVNAAKLKGTAPKLKPEGLPVSLVASGDVDGFSAGQKIAWGSEFEQAMIRKRHAIGARGAFQKFSVAQFRWEYPEERRLDQNASENLAKIEAVVGPKALAASGGFCAPLAPIYDQFDISVADRPLRDALTSFNASRGGVKYAFSPNLSDLEDSVGTWSNETDITPGQEVKNCLEITCGDTEDAVLEAVTRCLKIGNFMARAFPERVTTFTSLSMSAHARLAERTLLDALAGFCTTAIAGGTTDLGATRMILRVIDQAVAAYRNRNRTGTEMRFTLLMPDWIDELFRVDLEAEQPGASTERLAVQDAQIAQFFAVRNIDPVRILEGETGSGQDFVAQPDNAALEEFPANILLYLFPAGSFLFLDGGVLDLGLVRDSTLNSTNDYKIFAETFEGLAHPGPEALKLDVSICPNGGSSAAVEIGCQGS